MITRSNWSTVLAIPLITIALSLTKAIEAQAVVATPATIPTPSVVSNSTTSPSVSATSDTTTNGTCSYSGSVSEYLSCQKSRVSTTALVCGGMGVTLGILLIVFGGVYLCQRNRRVRPQPTNPAEYEEEESAEYDKPPITEEQPAKYKSDRGGRTRTPRRTGGGDKAAMVESGTDEEMGTPPPPFRAVASMEREGNIKPVPPSQVESGRGDALTSSPPRSQAQAQAQARYHAQVQAQTRHQAQGKVQRAPIVEKDLPPQPNVPTQNPLETELAAKQVAEVSPKTIPPEVSNNTPRATEIVNSPSPATQPRTLYHSNPDLPAQASRSRPPPTSHAPPAVRQSSYSKRQSIASVHFAPPALPPPSDAPPLPAQTTRPAKDQRDTFGRTSTAPLNIRKSSAPTIGGIPSYYDPSPRPPGNGRRPSAPSFYDARTGQSLDRPATRVQGGQGRPKVLGRVLTEGSVGKAEGQGRKPSGEGDSGESRPAGGRKPSTDRGGMI